MRAIMCGIIGNENPSVFPEPVGAILYDNFHVDLIILIRIATTAWNLTQLGLRRTRLQANIAVEL
jgi:hypothetical protein